jgi:hypothetical protein
MAEGADAAEQLLGREPLHAGHHRDRVEHALFQLARRGRRLGGADAAVVLHQHQVGEGAADIDTEVHGREAPLCEESSGADPAGGGT